MTAKFEKEKHSKEVCEQSLGAVRDALYVLNGKWKLPIIVALSTGPMRFKELQRTIAEITPKILSKELKDLELNDFVNRKVYPTIPVSVEYSLTPYSRTLDKVLGELRDWGLQHRKRIFSKSRQSKKAALKTKG
jgi:DNA-binding HxlR family transcriptional regulator